MLFVHDLQAEFTKKHKEIIKKFGMIRKYDDSKDFLMKHPVLVCEETANYLVLWCIDLEIEEVRTRCRLPPSRHG